MLLQQSPMVLFPFLVASHTLQYLQIFGWPTATTASHWHRWLRCYSMCWSNASAYGVIEWSQRLQHGSRAGGSVTFWGTLEGTPLPLDPTAPSPGTPLSVLPPLASHQRFCTIWLNQVPWGSVPLRRQTFWEWALIGYNLLIVPRMLMFLFLIWQYLGASQSSPRNPPCRRW